MFLTRPRAMPLRPLLGSMLIASTLALGACGSDDDDSNDTDTDGDLSGETSMPAPGTDPDATPDLTPIAYEFPLTVEEEIPAPVGADGASGSASLVFDPETRGMTGTISYAGLTGPSTMAHIHEQVAGEDTGPPIVTLVPNGTADGYMVPGDTILTVEQAESLETGLLYVNVHTAMNARGEIRGQIVLDEDDDS